uniref:Notch ligand N-terminal domain-containing protein n=1 Tax=Paramormyrops kingsleyae TaxID=1676925 RepID=A0A3B3SKJ6_9TELE
MRSKGARGRVREIGVREGSPYPHALSNSDAARLGEWKRRDREEEEQTWEDRRGSDTGGYAKTVMRDRKKPVIFLVALALRLQATCAVGTFELQIRQVQNPHGLLQNGECCDRFSPSKPHCSPTDQCDTFFRACLKEYQARVAPTGTCTFGSGSTSVLGGNSFSVHHHGHHGTGGVLDSSEGHIAIPFKYAWPVSAKKKPTTYSAGVPQRHGKNIW